MHISREIGGRDVDIKLTDIEIFEAYLLKQYEYDKHEVQQYFVQNYALPGPDGTCRSFEEEYGLPLSEARGNIDEIVSTYRRFLNSNKEWICLLRDAVWNWAVTKRSEHEKQTEGELP